MPIDRNGTYYTIKRKKKRKKEEEKKRKEEKKETYTRKKSRWAIPFWDTPLLKLYTAQCNILMENI